MLHILLLAVKWIGILLAVLLAVILLAVALVLFCPLRYRAKMDKTVDEWEAQGRISWLFGLIGVTVKGGSEKKAVEIRVCGIRLSSLKKIFSRKRRGVKKKPDTQGEPSAADVSLIEGDISEKSIPEKAVSEESIDGEQDPAETGAIGSEEHTEGNGLSKDGLLKRLCMKIAEKCRGVKRAFGKFVTAIQDMHDKAGLWKRFLGDPHTGAAAGMAWQQACRLLRHAGPQKWEGGVYLGLGDPAATGQVLAILGAMYPVYGGHLSVVPVWDRKVLEGKVSVKGRIYGIAVLCMAVKIYFDKNIRYVIRWFRRNGGNYVTGS